MSVMSTSCININHPEFKDLLEDLNKFPSWIVLPNVELWQKENGTDSFPSENELKQFLSDKRGDKVINEKDFEERGLSIGDSVPISDVFESFINKSTDPMFSTVAKAILPRLEELNTTLRVANHNFIDTEEGHYSIEGNEIVLNANNYIQDPQYFNNKQSYIDRLIMHEVLHAFTSHKIKLYRESNSLNPKIIPFIQSLKHKLTIEDRNIISKMQKLFNYLATDNDFKELYGSTNLEELIAEGLTDPKTIKYLSSKEVPEYLRHEAEGGNLFEAFLNLIVKLFGITTDNNALESLTSMVSDMYRGYSSKFNESYRESFTEFRKKFIDQKQAFKERKLKELGKKFGMNDEGFLPALTNIIEVQEALRKEGFRDVIVNKTSNLDIATNKGGYYFIMDGSKIDGDYKEASDQRDTAESKTIQERVDALTEIFNKKGIAVTVAIDDELETAAKVDYTGKDSATITVKSKVLGEEYEHEFGHVFIDILGVNHPSLVRLYDQIKANNSAVLSSIKELYPNLEGDDFKREVMATVIGREANKLDIKEEGRLRTIIRQVIRAIANFFGKEVNWAKELAIDMTRGNFSALQSLDKGKTQNLLSERSFVKKDIPIHPDEYIVKLLADLKDKILQLNPAMKRSNYAAAMIKTYKGLLDNLMTANEVISLQHLNHYLNREIATRTSAIGNERKSDKEYIADTQEFINMFMNIQYIQTTEDPTLNKAIWELKKNIVGLTELNIEFKNALYRYITEEYSKFAKVTLKPGEGDKIFQVCEDLNMVAYGVDALYNNQLPLFQILAKRFNSEVIFQNKDNMEKFNYEMSRRTAALHSAGIRGYDFMCELTNDTSGEKTARLIQPFTFEFQDKLDSLNDRIRAYEHELTPEGKAEYAKALDAKRKFEQENRHQPFTKEYYDLYKVFENSPVGQKAQTLRINLNNKIRELETVAKDPTTGEIDPSRLSDEDYAALGALYIRKDELASDIYYETGLQKNEEDLAIAALIRNFNESVKGVYESKALTDEQRVTFENIRRKARERGQEYFTKWAYLNTKNNVNPIYYKILEEAYKLVGEGEGSKMGDLNKEIDAITANFKSKRGYVNAAMLKGAQNVHLWAKILEIEQKRKDLLKEGSNRTRNLRPFSIPTDLIFKGTQEYYDRMESLYDALTDNVKKYKEKVKAERSALLKPFLKEGSNAEVDPTKINEATFRRLIQLNKKADELRIAENHFESGLFDDNGNEIILDAQDIKSLKSYGKKMKSMLGTSVSSEELRQKALDDFEKMKVLDKENGTNNASLFIESFFKKIYQAGFDPDIEALIQLANEQGDYSMATDLEYDMQYSVMKPQDKWIDEDKTKGSRMLHNMTQRIPSLDYETELSAQRIMLSLGNITQDEYDEWMDENHYEDPVTGERVPLRVWTVSVPKQESIMHNGKEERLLEVKGPSHNWVESRVADKYINPLYEKNSDPITGYGNPIDKYKSKRYEQFMALPSTDPRKAFFDFVTSNMNAIDKEIGYSMYSQGYFPGIHQRSTKELTLAKVVKGVKTHYTSNVKELGIYRSDDLGSRLIMPFAQKLENKFSTDKSTPAERMEIMKANRLYHRQNVDYDLGSTYRTAINELDLYRLRKDFETEYRVVKAGFLSHAIIDRDGNLKRKIPKAIRDFAGMKGSPSLQIDPVKSNLYKRLLSWESQVLYNEGLKPFYGKIDENGNATDYNKVLKDFNKFVHIKALGVNVFAAASNVILGEVMMKIEAIGARYIGMSAQLEGAADYYRNITSIASDAIQESPLTLVGKLLHKFGSKVGEVDKTSLLDSQGNLRKGWLINQSMNSLMFLTRAGDYMIQSKLIFAFLRAYTAKNGEIVKKSKGEKSLMELARIKDGIVDFGQVISKESMSEFREKISYVFQEANGTYDDADASVMQSHALTALAMVFRKWIRPAFLARFRSKQALEKAGGYVEGRYITTFHFLGAMVKDIKNFKLSLIGDNFDRLEDYQKANIRKMVAELGFMAAAILVGVLIGGAGDDDDEQRSKSLAYADYLAARLRADLMFFTFVTGDAFRIVKSPFTGLNTIQDTFTALYLTSEYPFQDDETRYEKSGPHKGESKMKVKWEDVVPIMNQIDRLQNPEGVAKYYHIIK